MWKKLEELIKDRDNQKRNLLWLLKEMKPFRSKVVVLMILNSLVGIINIVVTLIQKRIVDYAQLNLNYRLTIALAFVGIVLSLGMDLLFAIQSVKMTEKFGCYLRKRLFRCILGSDWNERRRYHSEELLSRITSDVSVISTGIVQVIVAAITFVIQFTISYGLLLHYEKRLAIFSILIAPIAMIANFICGIQLSSIHRKVQEAEASYRTFLQERISNADILLAFEQQEKSVHSFDHLQEQRMNWVNKKNQYNIICSTIVTAVFSLTYIVSFCVGAIGIGKGTITYGTMTVFIMLVNQIQALVFSFGNVLPRVVGILASTGRVMQIASLGQEEFNETIYEKEFHDQTGVGIVSDKLTLSYQQDTILKDISFKILTSEKVLLKGASGVGKTTLIRAILGFIIPDEGNIQLVNGKGACIPCSKNTRCYISYVPQGNTLFLGTIEENLRIGCENATFEQMKEALEISCAWDFIDAMPDKLKTRIGERGIGLSEGQAQRIGIARAILKPASIFIFDESMSALDEATEVKILENIRWYLKKQTCIFISHRSGIGDYVDKVIEIIE